APPGDRLDVARVLRLVSEGLAQLPDRVAQHLLGDEAISPDLLNQALLGDQVGRVTSQAGKDLHRARLDRANGFAELQPPQGRTDPPIRDEEVGLPGTLHT